MKARASAKKVVPFMALSTMRSFHGSGVDGSDVVWPYGTRKSQITVLDLQGDIDTASLSNIVRGLQALEHFRYRFSSQVPWVPWNRSTDEKDDDDDEVEKSRWEPRDITANLLKYASNRLVSLDLAAATFKAATTFPNNELHIGSLRSFQV